MMALGSSGCLLLLRLFPRVNAPNLPFGQDSARLQIDKVQARASRAANSLVDLGSIFRFIFRGERGLHFHAGGRTSKYEEPMHGLPVWVPIDWLIKNNERCAMRVPIGRLESTEAPHGHRFKSPSWATA